MHEMQSMANCYCCFHVQTSSCLDEAMEYVLFEDQCACYDPCNDISLWTEIKKEPPDGLPIFPLLSK
jgi:hypothetical protein